MPRLRALIASFRSRDMPVIFFTEAFRTTSVCHDSTARDAAFRDYRVLFLSDGTATSGLPDLGFGPVSAEELHRVTLANVAMFFGAVCTVADVLAALQPSEPAAQRDGSAQPI